MSGNMPFEAETNIRKIVQAVRELFSGHGNSHGSCTLTASAGSTVVQFFNCSNDARIFLSAKTANASAELAAGQIYISAVDNGQFTITHRNNAQTDRSFDFVCFR